MTLSIAAAATLDFVRFELTGGEAGVSLEYVLAADDWVEIAQRRAEGEATSVSVTLEAADYSYTAVVPLNAASRRVDLSVRPWPQGTSGTVAVRQGAYDELAVPGAQGVQVGVPVSGGVEGARPANAPLSSDRIDPPPAPPQPVASLPPPEREEPVPPTAPVPAPAPEPLAATREQLSVVDACRRAFKAIDEQGRCIAQVVARPSGAREVEACAVLERPRYVQTCIDTVAFRPGPYEATIAACTTALGATGDALDCVRVAADHRDDPVPDILACSTHLTDPADVVGCVKRAARIDRPLDGLLRACALGFATSPLECVARAARSPFDRADLVTACTIAFALDERERCVAVLAAAAGPDAGGVVRACVRLYDDVDVRFDCMARARSQPSETRVLHCGELDARSAQLDCIGR